MGQAELLRREVERMVRWRIDAIQFADCRSWIQIHQSALAAPHGDERIATGAVLEVLADADGLGILNAA
jgi:hypothetical protein